MSSSQLLELPVTRGRLHALAAAGVLDAEQLERALGEATLRPRTSWSSYLYWHALLIGALLLLAGVIFFVAANWSGLGGFVKMGIVAGAMICATAGGGWLGDTLAGRVATLLGGLLFGPLVALYGQIYQTGADAWELFALWTLVLVAYAALVRFVGTWVVVILGLHLTCFTWMAQGLGLDPYEGTGAYILAGLALLDGGIVALVERLSAGRERNILVHVAGFAGLALLLPFGVMAVVDELPSEGLFGLLALLASLAALWFIYRWRRPDLGMLAALASVVTILVSTALGRLLFDTLDAELFGVAALGLLVCAQVWGFTRWLLNWRREHTEASP